MPLTDDEIEQRRRDDEKSQSIIDAMPKEQEAEETEEVVDEEPEAEETEEETPEETEPTEEEVEAEKLAKAQEDDVYGADGKLLGKFKTPKDLAKSYKELEKSLGRSSNKVGNFKKTLAAAGYTFDAEDNPIPPAEKAKVEEAPALAVQPIDVDEALDYVEGVEYDPSNGTWAKVLPQPDGTTTRFAVDPRTGIPIVSDEEWAEYAKQNPHQYRIDFDSYTKNCEAAVKEFESKRLKRVSEAQDQEKTKLVSQFGTLPEEVSKTLLEKYIPMADDYASKIPLKDKGKKGYYTMAAVAAIAQDLPGFVADIYAKGQASVTSGRKVIARSTTSSTLAPPKPASKVSLTADELEVAKQLGISPEKYAQYR